MSEVAVVRDTSAQQRSWGRLDGVPAVRISIRKQPEANTVEVADGVRARLAQLHHELVRAEGHSRTSSRTISPASSATR